MRAALLNLLCLGFLESQALARTIPITENFGPQGISLGQGYDSSNGSFLDRCWTGELAYAGAQQARIQLEKSSEKEDVLRNISASFEGAADLLILSGSIKTTVSSLYQERRYRETLIYSVEYRGKNAILRDPVLLPNKARLRSLDPERFQALCGDTMVSEALFGGQLYLFVHFDFVNQEQRDQFNTKVKVDALGFSKTKTLSKDLGWNDRSTQVTIDATQIGGQPQFLQHILSTQQSQCQLADISACGLLIDSLFRYATTEGGNTFPAQMMLTEFSDQSPALQPALLAVKTPTVALRESRRSSHLEILAKRLGVLEADESWLRLKSAQYPRDSQRFLAWQDFLAKRIRPLKDRALRTSYMCQISSESPCNIEAIWPSQEWKTYLEARTTLEPDYAFLDACLVRSNDDGIEMTVKAILAHWGHSQRSTAICEEVAQQLRTIKFLDLSGKQLTRLEPLSEALALEAIDLSHNKLESIAVASHWKQLKWINLQSNLLTSLEPLRHLDLLHILATYNLLPDVRSLNRKNYEKVFLHGNSFVSSQDVPIKATTLVRTEDELCALQRKRIFDEGWIATSMLQAYTDANFLPQREAEAITVKPCSIAAPEFDVIEAKLFPAYPFIN